VVAPWQGCRPRRMQLRQPLLRNMWQPGNLLDWIAKNLRKEDFAFTVEVRDKKWDVYRFVKDGKKGTMAYMRQPDGTFVIGVFRAGTLTEEEVRRALRESEN